MRWVLTPFQAEGWARALGTGLALVVLALLIPFQAGGWAAAPGTGLTPAAQGEQVAPVTVPSPQAEQVARLTLPNGMRVIAKLDPGTDIVALDLLLDLSVLDEPAGKAGIRCLVQRLLLRGTENETGESIGQRLAEAGGVADVSVGLDYVEIYALVPDDGFDLALSALADMVRHPAFAPEQVERQRQAAIETARGGREEPFQGTYLALREALYDGHPYGRSAFGEPASLASLTREDLVSFHEAYYRPGRAVLAVCGGVGTARVMRAARGAFGDWAGAPGAPRARPRVEPLSSSQIVAREGPGQQAHLMLGFLAPVAGEPGYYEMQMLDSLLSGRAGARLPKLLRDELGLAYDVSSFYPTLAGPSHLAVYVTTTPYQIEEVRTAILEVLASLSRGSTSEEELARAKRYLLGSYALARQRMKDQAYSLAWCEILGLGSDFDQRYAREVGAVTAAGVQRAAQSLHGSVLAVTIPGE